MQQLRHDCGFVTHAKTAARAVHSLRIHSCDRHRKLAALRDAQYRRRHRPPKPCLHKIARHVHGEYKTWVLDKCRCNDCWKAYRAYDNARHRRMAQGRWSPYVDAAPARAHVKALMAAGLGPKLLAQASGVPHGAISKLIYGDYTRKMPPSRRIRVETEAKLLAVAADTDTIGSRQPVPPYGTVRRLRALVWLGWSIAELQRMVFPGSVTGRCYLIINGKTANVGAGTARTVAALFDRLQNTRPPQTDRWQRQSASAAHNLARRRGWCPPGYWDDEWIDTATGMPAALAVGQ